MLACVTRHLLQFSYSLKKRCIIPGGGGGGFNLHKLRYGEINTEAARKNVADDGGCDGIGCINEILPDETQPIELDGVKQPRIVIRK